MKNPMVERIRRIEDLLKSESVTGLVALKRGHGFEWNGTTYPDKEALDEALREISGEYPKSPLVIIEKRGITLND